MSDATVIELPTRTFVYGSRTFPEPGHEYSNEMVRDILRDTYPDLANCKIIEQVQPDGSLRVEFAKQAGNKGALTADVSWMVETLRALSPETTMSELWVTCSLLATHLETLNDGLSFDDLLRQVWQLVFDQPDGGISEEWVSEWLEQAPDGDEKDQVDWALGKLRAARTIKPTVFQEVLIQEAQTHAILALVQRLDALGAMVAGVRLQANGVGG
jgi:PRTRC genetic system protein C